MGLGYTDARLTATDEPLPRIPPLHGRVALELPYRHVTVTPEISWAAAQDAVFRNEAPTAGYALVNLNASYTFPTSHAAHVFSIRGYNLTNAEYRLHTSFIKDLAPEIGRGVSVSYSLRFF
jgi:iron complex outermembrane receptor protein